MTIPPRVLTATIECIATEADRPPAPRLALKRARYGQCPLTGLVPVCDDPLREVGDGLDEVARIFTGRGWRWPHAECARMGDEPGHAASARLVLDRGDELCGSLKESVSDFAALHVGERDERLVDACRCHVGDMLVTEPGDLRRLLVAEPAVPAVVARPDVALPAGAPQELDEYPTVHGERLRGGVGEVLRKSRSLKPFRQLADEVEGVADLHQVVEPHVVVRCLGSHKTTVPTSSEPRRVHRGGFGTDPCEGRRRVDQGTEVERLATSCEELLTDVLRTPPGYHDSMALCVLDAVWSLGVRYWSVENVLDRYRRWVGEVAGGDADRRNARHLVADITAAGGPVRFAEDVVDNRARTSPRSGILKAEAVQLAAAALNELGVNTTEQFLRRCDAPALEAAPWIRATARSSPLGRP